MKFFRENRGFIIFATVLTILSLLKISNSHAAVPIKQLQLACTSKSGAETFVLKVANGVARSSNVDNISTWALVDDASYQIKFDEGLLEINRFTGRYQWVMHAMGSIYNNVGECSASAKPRL